MTRRRLTLRVVSGANVGLELLTEGDRCVIGTHPTADLRVEDRTVSRFHCEVVVEASRVVLADLGSRNGTYVDDVRVERCHLHPGAVIRVGQTRIEVRERGETTSLPLSTRTSFGTMVGASPAMRRVFATLERAADSDATVLVTGETGTGKEAAAESIHAESARRDGPFIVVDCGALPANLLESELFGHERGAFTGAQQTRIGAFEAAQGGTVFLDEIGELPVDLQPTLLRVLEKRHIKRLGSTQHREVDVRVVAATNRDLRAEVNARTFRSDLYYRLAVLEVRLPPLRERVEDVPMLIEHLLAGRTDVRPEVAAQLLSTDFLARLARYPWPGNVRELRNHLERCIALREAVDLESGSIPPMSSPAPQAQVDIRVPYSEARKRWLESFERRYLESLLAAHEGNVSAAARASKLDRAQLYRLLWRHGLRDRREG
jgi:transcriptional regulator with PAS, ATPase and Fis domain